MTKKITVDIIITAIVLIVSASVSIQCVELYKRVSTLNENISEMVDEIFLFKRLVEESLSAIDSDNRERIGELKKDIGNLEKAIQKVEKDTKEISKKIKNNSVSSKGVYEVTAYTAGFESTGKNPGDPYYGITASGEKVKQGITIACPPQMPFGTKLKIEGVGERICQDRGGAIKGNKLDVYMPNLYDVRAFGRQKLKVQVIS